MTFRGGYHGDTTGAMAVSDPGVGMHARFSGLLPEHHVVGLPQDDATAATFARCLERQADELAGMIVEPLVQGAGGMRFHSELVLRRLREVADRYQLILIFDEIFTGFGRTGSLFACEAAGVSPDIITLSKALTGGTLPLAVTIHPSYLLRIIELDDKQREYRRFVAELRMCKQALRGAA